MLCRQVRAYADLAERSVEQLSLGIRLKLRTHMDAQTLQEVSLVEAFAMPEMHMTLGSGLRSQRIDAAF